METNNNPKIKNKKVVSGIIMTTLIIGIVVVALSSINGKQMGNLTTILKNIFGTETEPTREPLVLGSVIGKSLTEDCYIRLEIEETKVRDDIQFSVLDIENIYGIYDLIDTSPVASPDSDYVFETYDAGEILIERYPLYSARFLISEDFSGGSPEGEVVELDSGIISIIISSNPDIAIIKIVNNSSITSFNLSSYDFSCIRTCKIENEFGELGEDECCLGFIPVLQDEDSFVCVNCGDGTCSEYEDDYVCPEDCSPDFTCPEGMFKTRDGCLDKSLYCEGADINHDTVVDVGDLGILSGRLPSSGCGPDNDWCNWADANKDTMVDVGDLGIIAGHWEETGCSGPE